MNTVRSAISRKENERRRAHLPQHVTRVAEPGALYFEQGCAEHLGIPDEEYDSRGVHVASRREVYGCDIVCNPKAPEPAEMQNFRSGQTLFGWVHAVQGRPAVEFLRDRKMSAIAWEEMFEAGRHCFWRNNELAGEVIRPACARGRSSSTSAAMCTA